MMSRILVLAAMLFAFANANATRVLDPVESAVEVSLANLTLPASATGTITLRECNDCPYSNHRLGDGATFLVNRKPATFEEMTEFVAAARQSRAAIDGTLVTVFLDVNTARITRISLRRNAP
jgi:hypothetical protein